MMNAKQGAYGVADISEVRRKKVQGKKKVKKAVKKSAKKPKRKY